MLPITKLFKSSAAEYNYPEISEPGKPEKEEEKNRPLSLIWIFHQHIRYEAFPA